MSEGGGRRAVAASPAARVGRITEERLHRPDDRDRIERELLRHFLAAIAYRTQKALRDAPPGFPEFSAGNQVRTPAELLGHMTSLMGYAVTLFVGGSYPFRPPRLATWDDEVARFHEQLAEVASHLERGTPLSITHQQLLQGPLADTMTHVGQLAMLRRMAASPVAPENFIQADVRPDRLGPEQPGPAAPDAVWPERPGSSQSG